MEDAHKRRPHLPFGHLPPQAWQAGSRSVTLPKRDRRLSLWPDFG